MNKKGLLVVLFFGVIMVTSGFGLHSIVPDSPLDGSTTSTVTGTPADNFPDEQRAQFCGSSIAKSTDYIQEFSIPTVCTNPLAIVTDYDGNVWFAQTNTGNLAKFDPITESFTEYQNDFWPQGGRSMMWGADYAPDDSVWFTDDSYDSLWKFSIADGQYTRVSYPTSGDSLPQKLLIDGSQIIVNDFTGNKITFLNPTLDDENINYLSIPSLLNNSVTSAFTLDVDDNVWYTNWIFQQGGVLIKFKQNEYREHVALSGQEFLLLSNYIDVYPLPLELVTPNGITISDDSTIWLADTTSSYFFNFDPATAQYIQYVTSDPLPSTYGNLTGIIKSTALSRPYWIESDPLGRIIFNEQTGNNISVMDPKTQSLVEYQIPSKNPGWGDCDIGTGIPLADCGIAQVFDFAVDGEKIWFTEWAENNIGVVDTSVPLPLEVLIPSDSTIVLANGTSQNLNFIMSLQPPHDLLDVSLIASSTHDFLDVSIVDASGVSLSSSPNTSLIDSGEILQLTADIPAQIFVIVAASEDALSGTYKILLGAQSSDIAVSKYLTVHIP